MVLGKTANVVTIYVYDGSSFFEISGIENYVVSNRLNEMSQFTFTFLAINAFLRTKIIEFAEIYILINTTLFLKGRIQTVKNLSDFKVVVTGFGMESTIFDKQFTKGTLNNLFRIDYVTPTDTNIIAKEILSKNSDGSAPWDLEPANPSTIATFGDIQIRFESAYKLKAIGELANVIALDWWITHSADPYDDDYIEIDNRGSDKSGSFSFKYTGSGANADVSNDQKDVSSTINFVRFLGYGDGVNQLNTSCYAQGNADSILSSDITATDTTISLLDASGFSSSGRARIMEELVDYSGVSGNDLTGCTRGVGGSTALAHKKLVFVEEHTDWADREELEDIMIANTGLNLQENSEIDRTFRDLPTMEIFASKYLLDHKDVYRRVELVANKPQNVIGVIDVGDTVLVQDITNGLDDSLRVQAMTLIGGFGVYKLNVELANKSLGLVELVKKINKISDQEGTYMLGATNIFQVGFAENCAVGFPFNLRFYVPDDIININKAKLNFKIDGFRAYSKSSATQSNEAITILDADTDVQALSSIPGGSWTSTATLTIPDVDCEGADLVGYGQILTISPVGDLAIVEQLRLRFTDGTNYFPDENGVVVSGNEKWNSNLGISGTLSLFVPGNIKNTTYWLQIKPATTGSTFTTYSSLDYMLHSRHSHDIDFGILEETLSGSEEVTIKVGVDGGSLTEISGSPFTAGGTNLDISEYITEEGQWYNIEFTPTENMRIETNAYLQVFIEST